MSNSVVDFSEAVKALKNAVFGIGYHVGPQFVIFGTGFVIHEDGWFLTNRHVLEPLLKRDDKGSRYIDPASRVLQFVIIAGDSSENPRIGYANTRVVELQWIQKPNPSVPIHQRDEVEIDGRKADLVIPPEPPDIGVCRVDLSLLPPESLPLRPVKMVSSRGLRIGTPLGILGYPQGLLEPAPSISAMGVQCSPILQTGCASAILPHPSMRNPTQLLLDMHVSGGSSGSPLFNVNGDVLGVVFASRQQFSPLIELLPNGEQKQQKNVGIYRETPIGCAVPSETFSDKINQIFPNLIT